MKALVCGGRDYTDKQTVFSYLDHTHAKHSISLIIHGAARGADSLAGEWAADRKVPVQEYKADWTQGKKAGILRNKKMLEEGQPDLVIAFPGGRGTADMVRRSKTAAIPVIFII